MGEFKSPSEKQSQKATPAKKSQETSSAGEAEILDARSSTFQLKKFQEASNENGRGSGLSQLQTKSSNHTGTSRVAQFQGLSDTRTASMQSALIQKKENKTGIPDALKAGMESVSGLSLNDVTVHRNSDKPAQLQAHAYAQGTDVHLAPGQEKHLPHELGHVVQQKQGRVAPTTQLKGDVAINDSPVLEKEADTLGAKAKSLGMTAEAGIAQRKAVEEEEPVQGKFVGTAQRQAAEEEEVLQGKFDGTAQRKAEEEEEVMQGKFKGTVQREGDETKSEEEEADGLKGNQTKIEVGGFEITYTDVPKEKKQKVEGQYKDSKWTVSGERELKDEAKGIWEYTISGNSPSLEVEAKDKFPIAIIPLGVPGISATISVGGSIKAGASGSGNIKFMSNGSTFTDASAFGSLTASLEASLSIEGGVTAGIPEVLAATGGAFGQVTGNLEGKLDLRPTMAGIKMDSTVSGKLSGKAGLFAEFKAFKFFTKRKELPLCEGTFGKFEGTKKDLPFSKEGFKQLANIRSYEFTRDTGTDGKAAEAAQQTEVELKEIAAKEGTKK
ncbi:MAG: hypothetical protein RLZZ207_1308 [Bacteroidota bacterium]